MPLVRKPIEPATRAKLSSAAILSGLVSSSPDERWTAARAAAGTPDLAVQLAAALPAEHDFRVREAMFTSLARMGTAAIAGHILPLLRSTDAGLRTGAMDALRPSPAAVRELLPQLLRDPSVDVRILSCELARSLPSKEATQQICAVLLNEPDVNVCAAAIEVLAEVGGPEALPILAQCAQRFAAVPFLCFAIQIATDRLASQSAHHRG